MHGIDLNSLSQSDPDALMFDLFNWVDLRKAIGACASVLGPVVA
jgi:hypothetical protein